MEILIKYTLLGYLLLNFGLTFIFPSYRVWKKTGIMPITFGKNDNAHDYIGQIFKLIIGLVLVIGVVYSFFPNAIPFLVPIHYLEIDVLKIIGYCLLILALLWLIIAQYQMSNSWRIGIDEKNKTDLVTHGVFHFSRNPIFLGMILTLLGFFLLIPNALTFMIFCVGYFILQVQVRLEEDFLTKSHGDIYLSYCKNTPRWF
jgi:protein-S-isoprenylcysteine O-methyltransferase Ste14